MAECHRLFVSIDNFRKMFYLLQCIINTTARHYDDKIADVILCGANFVA